ncbi:MAG: sugar-binding domain-containing protein [Ginsengibacter sp.]
MKKNYATGIATILIIICTSFSAFAQPARQVILFNDNWKFYKGDIANADKEVFNDNTWRQLTLPHDWSIEGPFDEQWASATAYLPAGIGWYRKTLSVSPAMRSKNIYLYFDGVYKNSEVWINGHYLGKRPNGFIPFQYELTKYLHATGKNVIAVKVDHSEFADSRWYTGSGIYRNVYMIAANQLSIDPWSVAFSTPEISQKKAKAKVVVAFANHSSSNAAVLVKAILTDNKGKQISQGQYTVGAGTNSSEVSIDLPVANPSLWSTDNPTLYTLKVLLYSNGKIKDDVTQHVGFRTAVFDKDKGFFLNGKNMKIKGVCIHDDAGVLGVAVPKEVWERRLSIFKRRWLQFGSPEP